MESCIFCSIVAGTAEASFVYRDELVAAFLDIRPIKPGHLLVVPLAHHEGLADLSTDAGPHLFRIATRLAVALRRSELKCDGVNLMLADGAAAGQEVLHAHLHVIPRWTGDAFRIEAAAWSAPRPTRASLDATAAAVRSALG